MPPAVTYAAEPGGVRPGWPGVVRRVEVCGVRLRVATFGDGPPLLMLNGLGGHLHTWKDFAEALSGRRIITFDAPGTGDSPPLRSPLRMRGLARLTAGLLDALDLPHSDVLGYSWGGALAQQLAHQAPARVRRLVLVATVPGVGGQPPSLEVMRHLVVPPRGVTGRHLRTVAPKVFGGEQRRDPTLALTMWTPQVPSVTWLGYAAQLYAIAGWSSLPWLHSVRHSTLVICGDDDPLVPLRSIRLLARRLPDATLHIEPAAGHLVLAEHPRAMARLIDDFLRS